MFDTRGTQIQDLTIIGNTDLQVDLVRMFYSTAITFFAVTIKGSGGSGVFVNQGSTVQFRGCVIEGHRQMGVRVSAGSVGTFGENSDVSTATVIQDNGGVGIAGNIGSVVFLGGNVSVLNNGATGVWVTESHVFACCETGLRAISGNRGNGIQVTGGSFRNNGPLLIEKNRSHGIYLTASSAQVGPSGTTLTIRENYFGVLAIQNSSVEILDSQSEHNKDVGVLVQDSSTVGISRSRVQFNGGAGVALYSLSAARIYSGNAITGNTGFDLLCTPDSTGRGTKDGVGKIFCSGFNQYPWRGLGTTRGGV